MDGLILQSYDRANWGSQQTARTRATKEITTRTLGIRNKQEKLTLVSTTKIGSISLQSAAKVLLFICIH